MCAAVKHAVGALFGFVLIFGPGVTLHGTSTPSIGSAPPTSPMVLGLTFSKAHARGTKRSRRRAKRKIAEREAEEKRREEAEKILEGTRRATLPADCVYDSYASFASPSELHVCGGFYYQRFEEDGVTGYVGHAVGIDRGEIRRARARRAEAEKLGQAEAKKQTQATQKATLSTDCRYDSYASFTMTSNVYTCGGVQYMQTERNGVTVYDRRTAGSDDGKAKGAKPPRVDAEKKRRAEAEKKQRATRRATLPKGCTYDSYASFFTSSNVYACGGVRYRQYMEKGATGYELLDL